MRKTGEIIRYIFSENEKNTEPKSGRRKGYKNVAPIPRNNPRNIYGLFTNEFPNLNLTTIKRYIELTRKGLNFYKSLFFEYIRREDLHIGGVCQTRKLAAISHLKSALSSNEGYSNLISAENEDMAEYVIEFINNIDLTNFFTDIVEAQIQGVSIFEKKYGVRGNKIILEKIDIIPNHLIVYDDLNDEYIILDIENTTQEKIRAVSLNSLEDRVNIRKLDTLIIDKRRLFEVHSYDGNSQNGFQNGCIDSLILAYYFKRYGISDWSTYLEMYATPPRIGTYDPLLTNEEDLRALEEGVKNFGSDAYAILANGTKLEFPIDQGRKQSSDSFKEYIEYWNNSVSIRVLGQTLTTSIGDTGSYAAASVHNIIREDILSSDIMLIEDSMNRLIRELIDYNYSNVTEYPVFRFPETKGLADKKTLSEILLNLKDSGYEPNIEALIEEFGFELEKREPAVDSGKENNVGEGAGKKTIDELIKELI